MSRIHNKKRNTALLYEFLVRTISKALVEGDKKKSSIALRILRKHFRPGTQLYKEFRLFNSLVKTTVSSDSVSSTILHEARVAAQNADLAQLDREKSLLIRNINHVLQIEDFYDQPVAEYRLYATVQTLLNEWRKSPGEVDIATLAQHEDQLRKWLISEKIESEQTVLDESSGTTRLLMKVMMKKLNEKYSTALNSEQRDIIKSYAFSAANDDQATIKKKLEEVRSNLLNEVEEYKTVHKDSSYFLQKIDTVKQQLLNETLESIDDSTVSRFMLYSALKQELTSDDGDKK